MTTGGFREVDHDLLADYVGGALDGTPDEVTVGRLVEEDAAWADAYARLAPAVADVRADLLAWGAPAEEMPADVTDRIVAALAAAGEGGPVETARTPAGVRPRRPAPAGGVGAGRGSAPPSRSPRLR